MSNDTLEHELEAAHRRIAHLEAELRTHGTGAADATAPFRDLIDHSSDAVFVIEPQTGRLLDVNEAACRNLQYTAAELQTMRVVDIEAVLPDDFQWTTHVEHLRTQGSIFLEGVHRRKDGTTYPAEINTSYIERADDDYMLAIVRDGTQRRDAEARVRQLQSSLVEASRRAGMSDVATGLLHNVGNVLNSVNVTTELVIDGLSRSRLPKLADAVGIIESHRDQDDLASWLDGDQGRAMIAYLGQLARHLAEHHAELSSHMELLRKNVHHIDNVIALQQSYVRRVGVEERVTVPELVADALEINRAAFQRHNIDTVQELDDIGPITLDKHKVMQILLNLLSNAHYALRSAQPDGRAIVIRASAADYRLRIEVADNGIGIPEELMPKVFQMGFTTKSLGHGFGLHMSAIAAEEMGGSLAGASDGPGRGALFTLDLPLARATSTH